MFLSHSFPRGMHLNISDTLRPNVLLCMRALRYVTYAVHDAKPASATLIGPSCTSSTMLPAASIIRTLNDQYNIVVIETK